MEVINKTKYDTKYLRRLFLACEKHCFGIYLKHSSPKYRVVTVATHNTGWIGGYAWLGGCHLTVKLPKNYTGYRRLPSWVEKRTKPYEIKPLPAREVAQVYLHELGHCLGMYHGRMVFSHQLDVSWWPDEAVPLKVVKEKPKSNLIESRAAKAQKKLEQWQTKLKRARTYVKKYQTKVRYYEKKAAASK